MLSVCEQGEARSNIMTAVLTLLCMTGQYCYNVAFPVVSLRAQLQSLSYKTIILMQNGKRLEVSQDTSQRNRHLICELLRPPVQHRPRTTRGRGGRAPAGLSSCSHSLGSRLQMLPGNGVASDRKPVHNCISAPPTQAHARVSRRGFGSTVPRHNSSQKVRPAPQQLLAWSDATWAPAMAPHIRHKHIRARVCNHCAAILLQWRCRVRHALFEPPQSVPESPTSSW
jgi:hypothetical protein